MNTSSIYNASVWMSFLTAFTSAIRESSLQTKTHLSNEHLFHLQCLCLNVISHCIHFCHPRVVTANNSAIYHIKQVTLPCHAVGNADMFTSILLVFTVNFIYFGTDFVPIKFEAPTVGKLKNWKTEFHRRSLGSILLLWNSVFQFFSFSVFQFFSFSVFQFFSFSVLGFSWKVKTRKAEKTEKLKNWIP